MMHYQFKGRHILAEFYDVRYMVDDEKKLESFITECCKEANVTLVNFDFSSFDNGGYTLYALLRESHIAIHTYPEYNSIFLDVFTCGKSDTKLIVERLSDLYQPLNKDVRCIERGKSI